MDYSSYLRVLLSVWVGLGLGQLVQGLHRLARFRGTVQWDWVPVTWAVFSFVMFVQTWWAYFTLLQSRLWLNLFTFLLPLTVFVLLYLICASALPDISRTPEGGVVDLKAHYLSQHRYFFSLWAALLATAIVVSSLVRGRIEILGGDGFRIAGLCAALALAWSNNRRAHVTVTLISILALGVYIVLYSLRLA